jgi:hypothetical protein
LLDTLGKPIDPRSLSQKRFIRGRKSMTRYDYETLDIDGLSVTDAIAALYAWENENPEATETRLQLCYDGDSAYLEVSFQVPLTPQEIEDKKQREAEWANKVEKHERETYERLKIKYEGRENAH